MNISTHPKILVAGFGSWVRADPNPAALIVGALAQESNQDIDVIACEIPVNSASLYGNIEKLIDEHQPDGWIGLGVNISSGLISSEVTGINWRDFHSPDNTGATYKMSPIVDDGAPAYNATLPHHDIIAQLHELHIPAAISFHAGTHCCNQMLYSLGHICDTRALNLRWGFIHVPQIPDNIVKQGQSGPSMGLDMMTTAIKAAIANVAKSLCN